MSNIDFVFVDRESSYPNKFLVTPTSGTPYYVVLTRADEPVVVGTPLNAETLNALVSAINDKINSVGLLPEVSLEDEGKILQVTDGKWTAMSIPYAEEESY